ncbi:MAG: hypothetical protein P4L99_16770 [Chthoniobacter sp.]|nr:hypothetical protein [Chthoniobacter sp.]
MKEQHRQADQRKDMRPAFALSDIGIEDRDLRVEMFVLCDGATEHDGRLSLLGTYDLVHVSNLPCVLPVATVVLRVRFWPEECRVHTFRIVLTSPDGEPVGSPVEVTATLQPACGERSAACNLIVPFQNVRIEKAGEHTFDFYLDDKIEGRLPICVCRMMASQ